MATTSVTLCAFFRVPAEGVTAFQAYEAAVLPLLAEHGGTLERRLRTADGTAEVHIVSFADAAALERYRGDSRRAARAARFEASGAVAQVFLMTDVELTP